MSDSLDPQPIVDTILSDVSALATQFNTLVAAYRLIVGSAEEIQRIKGVNPEIQARAIQRIDRTGALLDMLLEILCCKISFSTDFLAVTCAPVDIFRLLQDCCRPVEACDTAKQIIELEALRQVLCRYRNEECFYDKTAFPPYFPPPPPPAPPATNPPNGGQQQAPPCCLSPIPACPTAKPPSNGQQPIPQDIQDKLITDIVQTLGTVLNPNTTVLRKSEPPPQEVPPEQPPQTEPRTPKYKFRPKESPPQ